jgi:pimeloyl-ACP methyl ester carboxylesterase
MDININYIGKGSGEPFIFLHGNDESSEYFCHQIDYFSCKYRVIAPDTRGHGKTPRGNKSFTLAQFADDLKDFLDQLNISKALILGFSDGANIAILFALKYPAYVDRLILNGANLNPAGVKLSTQIPTCIRYGIVSLIARFDQKAVFKKEMLSLMVNQPDIKASELSQINIPTLVIAGTKDMIKEDHTVFIHKAIAKSRLCIMEGDHFIAKKNSVLFHEKVELFLMGK